MSKIPLLLSRDGFSRLSHLPLEKNLKADWRLASTPCLVSRDSYWEQIAYYPTGNLIEVQKIIAAEVHQISPFPGKTEAFVIKADNGKTAVLYCCYLPEVTSKAEEYQIWRLIPETLPFYRSLYNNGGPYLIDLPLSPVSVGESPAHNTSSAHKLMINVKAGFISSLPVDSENQGPPLSQSMLDQSINLDVQEYSRILSAFRPLDYLDTAKQTFNKLKKSLARNKQLPLTGGIFLICGLLTFVLGQSAFLVWQHKSLSDEIASTRAEANQSIQLLNQANQSKADIDNINSHLSQHMPKAKIYRVLTEILSDKPQLAFKTINISPVNIQLQGITDNASTLLASLSSVQGFNNVQFSTPPTTVKNQGERFNIDITYDQHIYTGNQP